MVKFELVSSLEKIFPDLEPRKWENKELSGLYGEKLSLQIAYYCDDQPRDDQARKFFFEITSPLQDQMTYRSVGLVPSNFPAYAEVDDNYITTRPGLFPDALLPIEGRIGQVGGAGSRAELSLKLSPRQWRSIWIDINLNSAIPAGQYLVQVRAKDYQGQILWQDQVAVEVIGGHLPDQEILHTEWFHADCLADYYGLEVFSEKHWQIIENFVKAMGRHGINTLLTPIFTPPLDTQPGGERTTVQLVGVEKTGRGYRFDFSLLDRWIEMAFRNGIKYLEISHLFSQWGAKYAPKVMALKDGQMQRIFGWENQATGQAYQEFLHIFLPELTGFLAAKGLTDRLIFHISDEPHRQDVASYQAARDSVKDLLKGYYVMDALSDFEIYRSGVIDHPVVATDHIRPYLDHGVEGLWTYYCCSQKLKVSNRFMAMPSARNRILGIQLYLYQIKGFLHWGYNFYNSQYSLEKIDPYFVTDAGEAFPSGDAFLVYPGREGQVVESIRLMVLSQAFQDLRALGYLESLTSREYVKQVIGRDLKQEITFASYPQDPNYLLDLRARVNQDIKKRISH